MVEMNFSEGLSILLVLILLSQPLLSLWLIHKRNQAMLLHVVSIVVMSILFSLLIAYWPHFYRDMRLSYLGADLSGIKDTEVLANINSVHMEEAYELYHSLMVVGWPVSALFIWLFAFLPYVLLCYGVFIVIRIVKK